MKRCYLPSLASAASALLLGLTTAISSGADRKYETGYPAINKISKELYDSLEAGKRGSLRTHPIVLEEMNIPCVNSTECPNEGGRQPAVQISAGCVALLNYLAHAKAIDETDRGFLKRYIASLTQATGEEPLPDLQSLAGAKGWDFDTLNHQISNFNQMAGGLIAIEMAHHYLGHYKKYASRLSDGQGAPVPINTLLTPAEWRDAVVAGSRNALKCGLGLDGINVLYETIDRMPSRPAWTAYFLPEKTNVAKIRKELVKIEKDFFLAGN